MNWIISWKSLLLVWPIILEGISGYLTPFTTESEIHKCDFGFPLCPEISTKCIAKGVDDFYCECLPGYVLKEGINQIDNKEDCIEKNKCNFGFNVCPESSTKCVLKSEDDFYCDCLPGYNLKEGIRKEVNKDECIENTTTPHVIRTTTVQWNTTNTAPPVLRTTTPRTCTCGRNSLACHYDRLENKICLCQSGHAQRNGTCSKMCASDSNCLNGGLCNYDGRAYFCHCKANFKGDRCEINDVCESLNDVCKAIGAVCVSIDWMGKGVCECRTNQVYNRKMKVCEDICKFDSCVNGYCVVFDYYPQCRCFSGFEGQRCDRITTSYYNTGYIIVTGILCAAVICFLAGTIHMIIQIRKLKKKEGAKEEIAKTFA